MKKSLFIVLSIVLIVFVSCNPDSATSIPFDKLHAQPSTDYRIYNYVGDFENGGHTYLVLGTNLGIGLYDITADNPSLNTVIDPIARPIMLVESNGKQYVIYYEQDRGVVNPPLKAADLESLISTSEDLIYDAKLTVGGKEIVASYVYIQTNQNSGNTEYSYTLQEKEDTSKNPRTINFYNFSTCTAEVNETDKTIEIKIDTTPCSVPSSPECAPYIVGDGYYAKLDEDQSYRTVYDMNNAAKTNNKDKEIIAFYDEYAGGVLVDNSGSIFVNGQDKGDYGSFPNDNRRVAYSTFIDGSLFLGYKYGPEVISINGDGSTTVHDTSDINNETIVGIKYFNGSYFVVTEESGVIKTDLKII